MCPKALQVRQRGPYPVPTAKTRRHSEQSEESLFVRRVLPLNKIPPVGAALRRLPFLSRGSELQFSLSIEGLRHHISATQGASAPEDSAARPTVSHPTKKIVILSAARNLSSLFASRILRNLNSDL